MSKLAWHFTNDMILRDGTKRVDGTPEVHTGPVQMCESGLHYSYDPLDALRYAPGWMLSRVEVDDIVEEDGDKGVCRCRTPIKSMDVRDIILLWAADVAERAVRKYYVGTSTAPQEAIDTVRRYVRGEATKEECLAAAGGANAAADAAYSADAAYAADAAADEAADAAAYAVAYSADAASAANAVASAADEAADAAAYAVASAADEAANAAANAADAAADEAADAAAYAVASAAAYAAYAAADEAYAAADEAADAAAYAVASAADEAANAAAYAAYAADAAARRLLRIRLKIAFGELEARR